VKRIRLPIGNSINSVSWAFGLIAGILTVLMMLAVSYEVVVRYVFRDPTEWVLTVTEMMLVGCAFLGAAYTLRQDGHVRIDLIVNHLGRRMQGILSIITALIALSYCAILTWEGWGAFLRCMEFGWRDDSPAMLPLTPVYFLIPLGGFLLSIQYLVKIHGYVRSATSTDSEQSAEKAD
jgi:TRAP-type C4-dicarboxylate transport system permease small subunit